MFTIAAIVYDACRKVDGLSTGDDYTLTGNTNEDFYGCWEIYWMEAFFENRKDDNYFEARESFPCKQRVNAAPDCLTRQGEFEDNFQLLSDTLQAANLAVSVLREYVGEVQSILLQYQFLGVTDNRFKPELDAFYSAAGMSYDGEMVWANKFTGMTSAMIQQKAWCDNPENWLADMRMVKRRDQWRPIEGGQYGGGSPCVEKKACDDDQGIAEKGNAKLPLCEDEDSFPFYEICENAQKQYLLTDQLTVPPYFPVDETYKRNGPFFNWEALLVDADGSYYPAGARPALPCLLSLIHEYCY